jgi:prepilin-type N-terminal cleavage/methylation domain-containing protein
MKISFGKNRGFTLIELLVVISIVGLLSSIILVALNGARTKGVQAAALEFADTNYHAFGADAFLMYNFNSDQSNTVIDSSGNGFNASISGTGAWSPNTPSRSGKSFSFDGTTTLSFKVSASLYPYITCSAGTYGCLQGNSFTVSVWVDPSSNGAYYISDGGYLVRIGYTLGKIVYGPTYLYGSYAYQMPLNAWTLLTYSYTTDINNIGSFTLYINGNPVQSSLYTIDFSNQSNKYTIGSNGGSSTKFIGLMDDVMIYTHSLSAAQVQQLYAQGAAEHGISLK